MTEEYRFEILTIYFVVFPNSDYYVHLFLFCKLFKCLTKQQHIFFLFFDVIDL